MGLCNARVDSAGVASQVVATSQNRGEGSETVIKDEASLILARWASLAWPHLEKRGAIVKRQFAGGARNVRLLRAQLRHEMTMPQWMGRGSLDYGKERRSERPGGAEDNEASHELEVVD